MKKAPQLKPYGTWKSPITSDLIVSDAVGLDQPQFDGDDIYWAELRPSEGGRVVVVQNRPDGTRVDRIPAPFNARTRVHEYGGGSFMVEAGTVYFSDFADQRLYRQRDGEAPFPITEDGPMRYAEYIIDKRRNRIICIREDHTHSDQEAVNEIVGIALDDGSAEVLVTGNDFYASTRLSPDGSKLAWIEWHHPNMPWDGSELWSADVNDDGSLGKPVLIAGGETESIFQPEWSPDGVLHFVSDRTGWWNLYRIGETDIEPLCPKKAEFGEPLWIFGMSTYGFITPSRIICRFLENGSSRLALLETNSGDLEIIDCSYTDISDVRATTGKAVFRAGSPTTPAAIVALDTATSEFRTLRLSNNLAIDPDYLSEPRPIVFPTGGGLTAHALFYAPKSPDFDAPLDERPPLIVKSHGGPTSAAVNTLNLRIQYWTSRGFAVVDVNYGGSTGYGREYRERLKGKWGIVDVEDCVNAALYLVENGEADGERLAITGGSAGGYTTLAALTFHDVFSAGASHYGVSDLEALVVDTHKYESRYLDGLIGPYPERKEIYRERSPIHFTEKLSCPLIIFQGLEDKVVPPNQAEKMVNALREKGLPVAYVPFEGEQHGFRRAENIKRTLDGELYFYSRVFGFIPSDEIEPVPIENLE